MRSAADVRSEHTSARVIAYRDDTDHLDVLRNFMRRDTHDPAVIFQRMPCSVIDVRSYAGILYSRDPATGKGVFLRYARAVFGEDLMTGRLVPQEVRFSTRDEARPQALAVYHFWNRRFQLDDTLRAPSPPGGFRSRRQPLTSCRSR
jgi:hypothetical protein